MVTDEATEPVRRTIWPLILVALGLMLAGFAVVFFGERDVEARLAARSEGLWRQDWDTELSPELPPRQDLRPLEQPVRLSLEPPPQRKFRWRLGHRVTTEAQGAPTVATRVNISGVESLIERTEQAYLLARELESAEVGIREEERPLGLRIMPLVEAFVSKARAELKITPDGRLLGFDWVSASNPQIRRTLALLRDLSLLVAPQMPPDPVSGQASWSWELPLSLAPAPVADALLELQGGSLEARATLHGATTRGGRELAVIGLEFTMSARGALQAAAAEDEGGEGSGEAARVGAQGFALEGSGRGLLLFDLDTGQIHTHRVALQYGLGPRRVTLGYELSYQ